MLAHYIRCKLQYGVNMAAEKSEWSYVCNYQLKFDNLGVYPYV